MTIILCLTSMALGWWGSNRRVTRILTREANSYYKQGNTPQRVWALMKAHEEITGKRLELHD